MSQKIKREEVARLERVVEKRTLKLEGTDKKDKFKVERERTKLGLAQRRLSAARERL